MEKYYNHLTDKLEDLEPFMAKTLPRSKEEYLAREAERERPKTYKEVFGRENPLIKVAQDYLKEHPEEVIKLRDEKLVQELVDFAAKQNAEIDPNAFNGAPTEEEAYLEKREREGRPLITYEEIGDWKDVDKLRTSNNELDNHYNKLSEEDKEKLNKAITTIANPLKDHPANNIWKEETNKTVYGSPEYLKSKEEVFEPSRYMMGNDPYGDADSKTHLFRKNADGSVEYLRTPEQIIEEVDNEEDIKSVAEKVSMWILIGIVVAALLLIAWLA